MPEQKPLPEITTACCGFVIAPDVRYCPKCGWEARVKETR
jgi:uncharacterized OB-fold protein